MKQLVKTVVVTIIALTATVVWVRQAASQAPADRAAIEKQIVAMERAINDGFAKGDVKATMANIAKDGVSIDPMGVTKAADFEKMIKDVKVQSWNIDQSQFLWVTPQTVVHLYRWTGKGTMMGQAFPSPTWSSTVWASRDGKWIAVFHQETAAAPAPPAKK